MLHAMPTPIYALDPGGASRRHQAAERADPGGVELERGVRQLLRRSEARGSPSPSL